MDYRVWSRKGICLDRSLVILADWTDVPASDRFLGWPRLWADCRAGQARVPRPAGLLSCSQYGYLPRSTAAGWWGH